MTVFSVSDRLFTILGVFGIMVTGVAAAIYGKSGGSLAPETSP